MTENDLDKVPENKDIPPPDGTVDDRSDSLEEPMSNPVPVQQQQPASDEVSMLHLLIESLSKPDMLMLLDPDKYS